MYYVYNVLLLFDGRSIECDIDPEVIATSKIFSDDESTAVTSDTGTHVTVNGQQYLFYKLPHKVNMS